MAIVDFCEVQGRRGGALNVQYDQHRRTYRRTFAVETDNANDGIFTIRSHPSCPKIGDSYVSGSESDTGSYVVAIDVQEEQDSGGKHWTVTVDYGPSDVGVLGSNPVDWPIMLEYDTAPAQVVVWFDQTGEPIVNSARDRFEDPIVLDDDRPVIVVTRRENAALFSPLLAYQMNNSVNIAEWNGYAARTVKVSGIKPGKPIPNPDGGFYLEVPYRFEFREETWDHFILDQGYNELDTSNPPKPKPILNQGKAVTEPVLLDGSGKRLATNASPVSLRFRVYKERDFAILNLDFSQRYGL